jgi:hypothetical protein
MQLRGLIRLLFVLSTAFPIVGCEDPPSSTGGWENADGCDYCGPHRSACFETTEERISCDAFCENGCSDDGCGDPGAEVWSEGENYLCENEFADYAQYATCGTENPIGSIVRCCCE